MKKVLYQGLFALFLVFVVYGVAKAQPNLTLPTETAGVGTLVEVDLNFQNNGQVTSAELEILFDPNLVSIDPATDIEPSEALLAAGFLLVASEPEAGRIVLAIINIADPSILIPDGDIVLMDFSADQEGITPLTLSDVLFGDAAGMQVPTDNLTNGQITVEGAPPGEVNVTIVKSSDTTRVDPGVPVVITYNIILNSDGQGAANDVGVTDALPDDAVFQAADSSPECDMLIGPPNSVGCVVGTIPAGQERVLNITISITRAEGDDILNQAIVDFLDEFGERVEGMSNTFTIRVGGGGDGNGGGCSITTGTVSGMGAVGSFVILLIPAFAIGMRRLKRKSSK